MRISSRPFRLCPWLLVLLLLPAVFAQTGARFHPSSARGVYSDSAAFYSGNSAAVRSSPLALFKAADVNGSPTTTSLALCVGPTPGCPSDGLVIPPFAASLAMSYGQTFNGSAGAQATDNTALDPGSTIGFYDSFNGAPSLLLCTLGIAFGSSCPPSVGTTLGTGVGTHVFTAVYAGDATHAGSTSPSVTIQVSPDTTAAAISSSRNAAAQAQPVTFTATLTGNIVPPSVWSPSSTAPPSLAAARWFHPRPALPALPSSPPRRSRPAPTPSPRSTPARRISSLPPPPLSTR